MKLARAAAVRDVYGRILVHARGHAVMELARAAVVRDMVTTGVPSNFRT